MDELKPPGEIQMIGILHLVGGIMNILVGLMWGATGLFTGLLTFGIGLVYCCPAFINLPIGIMEVISAVKHLSKDHSGLSAPKVTSIVEIFSIMGCSMISVVCGIVSLVLMSKPEVQAYYDSKQLTG